MILDRGEKSTHNEKKGLEEYGAPDPDYASPPAYSSAGQASTSSAVVVATPSGSRLTVVAPQSSVPTNGLSVFTVLEPIKGSWLLDPLAALSSGPSVLQTIVQSRAGGRRPRRFRNMTVGSPTAKFDSRHGSISTVLRVVGDSVPAVATIRCTTRSGNIVLELVTKSPSRMVHIDAYSRSGNISLLIPRSFSGVVELRARRGDVELLPVLASSVRIVRASDKETVVLVGNNAFPEAGPSNTGDLARLCNRSGHLRLGFCGEDVFNESEGVVAKATQLIQKLTTKLAS